METPVLIYKASKIATAERKFGENFFEVLEKLTTRPSVSGLSFLFAAGGGTEEQFDEAFAKGPDSLTLLIMDGLSESGFLDKGAVAQAKKAIADFHTNQNQKTSQSSGEVTKA